MPQWIVLLVIAVAAWLVLAVGGGLVIGRLLRLVGGRRARSGPRRRVA
jgi:uncharacterized membrane protein YecN with MAPEG domain